MNFSSIPSYLDPTNWHQTNASVSCANTQQLQPVPPSPPPPAPPQPHGSGGAAGSIRPGSMADRARLANIPLPETALKCPRCESTNTKFCYFNNYSLSQPRHFCKTCRRYWTRGGALRTVPVGGGCRRNKRSKGGNTSKSPANSDNRNTPSGSTSSISSGSADILGIGPQIPPLRYMAPLHHHLSEFGISGEIGLNYNGIPGISAPLGAANDLNFQLGNVFGGGGGGSSIFSGLDQWRLQQQQAIPPQFPFLSGGGGLDSSSGLYAFEGTPVELSGLYGAGQVRPKITSSMISMTASQLASVKMEESNQQEVNLSKQLLGVAGNEQYWCGAPNWTDNFSSSSTSNPL